MRIRFYYFIALLILPAAAFSQKGLTTVGIQVKPIFPISFLDTGKLINEAENIHYETALQSGFSAGIVIRHNFTKLIAVESGINYVKRKYALQISDGSFTGKSSFRSINYEIPFIILTYIQVGEK